MSIVTENHTATDRMDARNALHGKTVEWNGSATGTNPMWDVKATLSDVTLDSYGRILVRATFLNDHMNGKAGGSCILFVRNDMTPETWDGKTVTVL
jgi:hypothetical protein